MSPSYIVTDQSGEAHLVEAPSNFVAYHSVAQAESVRIAHQHDIERYAEKPKAKKVSFNVKG